MDGMPAFPLFKKAYMYRGQGGEGGQELHFWEYDFRWWKDKLYLSGNMEYWNTRRHSLV